MAGISTDQPLAGNQWSGEIGGMIPPGIASLPNEKQIQFFGNGKGVRIPAHYDAKTNVIRLGLWVNEWTVEIYLIHEMAHWASFQYLNKIELDKIINSVQCDSNIIERIAYWTEKYYIEDTIEKYHKSREEAAWLGSFPDEKEWDGGKIRGIDYQAKALLDLLHACHVHLSLPDIQH